MTDAAIIIVLLWTMELYSAFPVSRIIIAAVNHAESTAKTADAAAAVRVGETTGSPAVYYLL